MGPSRYGRLAKLVDLENYLTNRILSGKRSVYGLCLLSYSRVLIEPQ